MDHVGDVAFSMTTKMRMWESYFCIIQKEDLTRCSDFVKLHAVSGLNNFFLPIRYRCNCDLLYILDAGHVSTILCNSRKLTKNPTLKVKFMAGVQIEVKMTRFLSV